MLLFQKRFHAGLVGGDITLTYRRWSRPQVKVGGRYRCHPIGVLEVDAIEEVRVASITEGDARRSGFASRAELLAYLRGVPDAPPLRASSKLFRVELHHGGDGDRVELALAEPSAEEIATITAKLARMDGDAPWTKRTLALIEKHPRVAASKLAARVKRETQPFKADVRRLKKLGLTQSFEVGYELSPRGRAYLAATRRRR